MSATSREPSITFSDRNGNRLEPEILLSEGETQFRNAFDYAAIGMALVGLDGSWLQVNHSLCEIVGYSESELYALTFQDMTHPDDLDIDLDCVQQMLAGELRRYQIEKRYFHKLGHEIWVLLSVSLMRDQAARPLYLIVQIQDITQSKKTAADLKAYQAESQALFEAMTDVVLIRDSGGRCLKILPTQTDKLYQPAEEMLGKTLHDTLPQAQADIILGYIRQALTVQQPIQGEYSLTIREQPVHFSATFSPLSSDAVIVVTHDITARKQTESNLELQSLIAKNVAEGVCLLRAADGIMVYANPKFERMFGYETGELLGKHVSILNYADEDTNGEEVACRIIQEIDRQGEYTYEVHNLKKDGTPFWCRATTSVFEHPEYGAVYAAVQADITVEKQAQAHIHLLQTLTLAISEAEDFDDALGLILRRVSEAYGWVYSEAWIPCLEDSALKCSPAFYSCAKPKTGCCASPALEQFRQISEALTFSPGEGLPGRVWVSQQPEWQTDVSEIPEAVFLRQAAAAECGIKAGLGLPIVSCGEVLTVLVFFRLEAVQIDPSLMASLFAVAAQLNLVMQRKRAEEELFKEKELAQVTLHSIGDAVITTDALGRIQYLNPMAQKLIGWKQSEVQGLQLTEIFQIVNGNTREPIPNPIKKALAQGCVVGLEPETVLISRSGREIAINDSAAPIRSRDNQIIGAVVVFQDVSDSRALSQKLSWQASHDALTQLINRREFELRLEAAIEKVKLHQQSHVLCFIDLDQFKIVNDTCGHGAGDELLRQITALLQAKTRKSDTLARLGGDEFGLLLHQCPLEQATRVANMLREQVQDFRFVWDSKSFAIGASIGIAVIDADCLSGDSAMTQADAACYEAKRRGRNRIHVYTADDDELVQQQGQLQWVNRLTQALEADLFCLYYQPIVSITHAEAKGEHYEVLLRLRDESGDLIPPGAFIPAAERYNLMHLIDRWVIRALFADQGAYYRTVWEHLQDCTTCSYLYTVNLSGASINDDRFIDFVREQFDLYQVPPQLICFEVTETVAIANLSKAAQLMRELQSLGCRFALDDFGSGMSSFGYLKNLPVDYIKIDGGFVKEMVDNPVDAAMVEAINRVGQVMGIQTIAEFVENEDILQKLKILGVDFAQGYGIARPRQL